MKELSFTCRYPEVLAQILGGTFTSLRASTGAYQEVLDALETSVGVATPAAKLFGVAYEATPVEGNSHPIRAGVVLYNPHHGGWITPGGVIITLQVHDNRCDCHVWFGRNSQECASQLLRHVIRQSGTALSERTRIDMQAEGLPLPEERIPSL